MKVGRFLRAVLLFVSPGRAAPFFASRLGYQVANSARIGFSWIDIDELIMADGAQIGHFNQIRGPFLLRMEQSSKIGHFNTLSRAALGISVGKSDLYMGVWSAITARHRVDLSASIRIGNYSTVAGTACQLWTHGYIHETEGLGRYRIDGSIHIGDNVYIGSMCFISMGVRIGNGVIVGGGTAVAKDLIEPGLYVSSPLRQLARPQDPETRADLEPVDEALSCDRVYRKRG